MSKSSEKTTSAQTWNTIRGTMKIFGNEFSRKIKDKKTKKTVERTVVKWSVSVGTKLNDEFVNFYLPVGFSKDAGSPDEPGLHQINVKNAFLTCQAWEDKDGEIQTRPLLMITEWEDLEDDE